MKLGKSRVARKPPILFPICSFIPDCIVLIGAVSAVPYKNGTGIGRENYPESLGNTFAVATMAGKDEASKQKSESISKDLLPF